MKASNPTEGIQIELTHVRGCTDGLGRLYGLTGERRQFCGLCPVEDQETGEEEGSAYSDELSRFRPVGLFT